jgi:hypothetical protein
MKSPLACAERTLTRCRLEEDFDENDDLTGLPALGASTLVAQQCTISTIDGGGAPPASAMALSVRVPISGGVATGSAGASPTPRMAESEKFHPTA